MSECKQCKSIIQDVVDDFTSGCSNCYPIAMAKMQHRITELEAQLDQLRGQQDNKAITMLFGLMGYLTSREEPITFSAYHNATAGSDILLRLIQANELKGDCDWDSYKPPKE